jgi:hypothetical protein
MNIDLLCVGDGECDLSNFGGPKETNHYDEEDLRSFTLRTCEVSPRRPWYYRTWNKIDMCYSSGLLLPSTVQALPKATEHQNNPDI